MPWSNDRESRRRSSAAYSAAYRRNRDECMRRAQWKCQLRLDGCIGSASECDHIVSVADGGGHDLANLRAACKPCHTKRTAEQGGGFRSSKQADPQPSPRTAW